MSADTWGYADPDDPRNGVSWHSGKPCFERGCPNPAGTAWSPYFCFQHNVERFERIDKSFKEIAARLTPTEAPEPTKP